MKVYNKPLTLLYGVFRSFENNWNTYKLLAHINPPDVKVSDLHFLNPTFP